MKLQFLLQLKHCQLVERFVVLNSIFSVAVGRSYFLRRKTCILAQGKFLGVA